MTIALISTKNYEATEVPALCIDLKKNKMIGKVTVKNPRLNLLPNAAVLTPNGEHLILSLVSNL